MNFMGTHGFWSAITATLIILTASCGGDSSHSQRSNVTTPNPINEIPTNPSLPGNIVDNNKAPSLPTNFTAMAVSDRSVTLMWDAATDDQAVVSYEVIRGLERVSLSDSLHATVSLLSSGTTYEFQVQAIDAQGKTSGFTPKITVSTAASASDLNGASLYLSHGCDACHGADGQGVPDIAGNLNRAMPLSELTSVIDVTMPPGNEGVCSATCAQLIANYVFANFSSPPGTTPSPPVDPVTPPVVPVTPPVVPVTPPVVPVTPPVVPVTPPVVPVTPPVVTPPQATGAELFSQSGCAACHGVDGLGTPLGSPLTRALTVAELTTLIDQTMPPSNPAGCDATCSTNLANYITANFVGKGVPQVVTDPFEGLPAGDGQINAVCNRLAAANAANALRDAFCGATRPTITSLAQLQNALGLGFVNPTLAGRDNNGQGGNPSFALTGHSSSLVARYISAINPRAIIFTPPNRRAAVPGFVTMGFARGEQFVEIAMGDRNTNQVTYFLAVFQQACNVSAAGCTMGDLLTPTVETNWTSFTLYDDSDLKNNIVDCLHCHQPAGPAAARIQRMQELPNPWTHWFRDNRRGGIALFSDFRAAHPANESYAGIPAALLNSGDPELLEDLIRGNGFGNQPNVFNGGPIEAEVQRSSPGQPANNNTPGVSTTWNALYNNALQGNVIPPPYHDVKVTDAAKLASMTAAYQAFVSGSLARADLPDIREVFLESRAFEIGRTVDPSLDGLGVITQACTQCHNSRLDQTITRARFNVNLAQMSDLNGGVLTGLARDQEIGTAINRMKLTIEDVRIMPPAKFFRHMNAGDIAKATQYLCSQVTNPIPQCVGP